MKTYYVDGEIIKIPDNKKPFGQGSEGKLYLINNKLYKVYYPNALNEGFGNKKNYHQSLLEIKNCFKKIILPESLMFESNRTYSYCGYVTEVVGNGKKKKEGVTTLPWNLFISNIHDFEQEMDLLTENRFLAIDFVFQNSVFSEEDGNLYMVDPGRYHHVSYFTIVDYQRQNQLILNEYFIRMLEREMIYFRLIPNRKIKGFIYQLQEEREDKPFSEYFLENSEKYPNIQEMIKTKGKYLK